ncbi:hypothetical protein GDO81_004829 [Engystomops pustulosus]|uniref:Secreted protein n=1 Tax=Engystomops pustulosus TaxID=76066 RepID=A0AAV7CL06_ENGPU|nr:hypothetical protein GDO81_004829 [Engystomops pustulosus]
MWAARGMCRTHESPCFLVLCIIIWMQISRECSCLCHLRLLSRIHSAVIFFFNFDCFIIGHFIGCFVVAVTLRLHPRNLSS